MDEADTGYYLNRAETELDLAQSAEHERAVHAHFSLAELYLERAYRSAAPVPRTEETHDAEHA